MTDIPYSQYPDTYYRISLKAIIRNDKNDVLVSRERGRTAWSLPGGGWDHAETDIECLRRELLEEVNYEGNFIVKPIGVKKQYLTTKEAWLVWIVYEVETDNMNFSNGVDGEELKFVDPAIFKDSSVFEEQFVYSLCASVV